VDDTSPTALTPIRVTVQGVAPSTPVTATFTAASGFKQTLNAVGIAPDGAVIVPVPLPIDPKTGATGAASLTMTLTQGTQTTKPVTLDVQDLPQLSDFGTSLGVITRTYYNYEEMALARQLGELTALAASPINHVDLSKEKANVTALLQAVIRARNDVDRVISNPALRIAAGSVNGNTVYFDANALTMSDRMIGTYLVSMGPTYLPPGTTSSQHVRRTAASSGPRHKSALNAAVMKNIADFLTGFNGVTGPAASFRSAANAESALETSLSVVGGLAGVVAIAGTILVGPEAAIVVGASLVAATVASVAMGVDVYHMTTDVGNIIEPPPGTTSAAAAGALAGHTLDLATDGVAFALGGSGAKEFLTDLSSGAQVAWQTAALVTTAAQQYFLKTPEQDRATSLNASQQMVSPLPSGEGFADVTGTVAINNGQGPIFSGLTAVEIGQPPFAYGFADANGNYRITVPTGAAFDTAGQPIYAIDPVTGTVLSSSTIDLSHVKPGSTVQQPPLSGTCVDTDASMPDSDDPDCD
jgi:hypothetical protein